MIFDAILNRGPVAPVRLNPEIPAELERIINKSLEKDRDLRYQHASDMRADLKRLKRETDSSRSGLLLPKMFRTRQRLRARAVRRSPELSSGKIAAAPSEREGRAAHARDVPWKIAILAIAVVAVLCRRIALSGVRGERQR